MEVAVSAPLAREGSSAGQCTEGEPASAVRRTRRVVRERARILDRRRSRVRSLLAPLAVSSALLLILCCAVWTVLDQYEMTPAGIPDASNQLLVLALWFLPISAALLALVLLRRSAGHPEREQRR